MGDEGVRCGRLDWWRVGIGVVLVSNERGTKNKEEGGKVRTKREKDDTHQKKMRIIEIATPESSAADRTSTGTIRSGNPAR